MALIRVWYPRLTAEPAEGGWPGLSELFFLSRFEAVGAPSLRLFCKGGYRTADITRLSLRLSSYRIPKRNLRPPHVDPHRPGFS